MAFVVDPIVTIGTFVFDFLANTIRTSLETISTNAFPVIVVVNLVGRAGSAFSVDPEKTIRALFDNFLYTLFVHFFVARNTNTFILVRSLIVSTIDTISIGIFNLIAMTNLFNLFARIGSSIIVSSRGAIRADSLDSD